MCYFCWFELNTEFRKVFGIGEHSRTRFSSSRLWLVLVNAISFYQQDHNVFQNICFWISSIRRLAHVQCWFLIFIL